MKINAYHIHSTRSNLLINSIPHNKERHINTAHIDEFLLNY